ncbi:MAG: hypothetical protein JO161_09425 [Planctomycetaceae bacterium]|nr:hypothetical protein [Planctomycetaceae bacterium]
MSNLITPNPACAYQTLLSLRASGFPDHRIYAAMSALFDGPADSGPEEPDADRDMGEAARDWEPASEDETGEWGLPLSDDQPYMPSTSDLADYVAWSEALERRRDYIEAMARADVLESIEDERRREVERYV